MSNNTPFNRGNTSDSTRDLYVPCRDVDTTALQYCDPQEFSCYSEGLRPSGNTRVLHSELQGPEQLPLAMPTPWRLETQNSGLDEGISRSGPSMLISAVQPPYLSFGPPHYAESNFILPPRPRGPISSILDGGTIELFRSRVPGSGRPRHENFDLAGSAATPDSRQANWSAPNDIPYSQEDPFDPPSLIYPTIRHEIDTTAPENRLSFLPSPHHGPPFYRSVEEMPQNGSGERNVYPLVHTNAQGQALGRPVYPLRTSAHEFPMTQAPDLFLAIDQYRPSLPSPSYPGSTPNFAHSSVDSSHNSIISPPPHPQKLVPATVGMEGMDEGIMHRPSHASGHSQHENFGQGGSSIAIEPAGPIGQQPRKSQKATNRNPCSLCRNWHVRCVVVADELGPLCEQCKGRGLRCEFPRK